MFGAEQTVHDLHSPPVMVLPSELQWSPAVPARARMHAPLAAVRWCAVAREPAVVVRRHGPRVTCFAAPYWSAPQLQPLSQAASQPSSQSSSQSPSQSSSQSSSQSVSHLASQSPLHSFEPQPGSPEPWPWSH